MFKPKIGDVIDCSDKLYIIIMDCDESKDSYTWRFLPSCPATSKEFYGTAGSAFHPHTTSHSSLGSYALICNIFDDIDWEKIVNETPP